VVASKKLVVYLGTASMSLFQRRRCIRQPKLDSIPADRRKLCIDIGYFLWCLHILVANGPNRNSRTLPIASVIFAAQRDTADRPCSQSCRLSARVKHQPFWVDLSTIHHWIESPRLIMDVAPSDDGSGRSSTASERVGLHDRQTTMRSADIVDCRCGS
jgi:hypothetical protein